MGQIPYSLVTLLDLKPGTDEDQLHQMVDRVVELMKNEMAANLKKYYSPHRPVEEAPMWVLLVNARVYQQTLCTVESDETVCTLVGSNTNDWARLDMTKFVRTEKAKLTMLDWKEHPELKGMLRDMQLQWTNIMASSPKLRFPHDPHGTLIKTTERRRSVVVADDSPFLQTDVFGPITKNHIPIEEALGRMCCVLYSFCISKGGAGKMFPKTRDRNQWEEILKDMSTRATNLCRLYRVYEQIKVTTNPIATRRSQEPCVILTFMDTEELMDVLWLYLQYDETRNLMQTCNAFRTSGIHNYRTQQMFLVGKDDADADSIKTAANGEQKHVFAGWDNKRKEAIHSQRTMLELFPSVGRRMTLHGHGRVTFQDTVVPDSVTSAMWQVTLVREDTNKVVPDGVRVQKCSQLVRDTKRNQFRPLRLWFQTQSRFVENKLTKFRLHITLHYNSQLCRGNHKFNYVTAPFRIVGKVQSEEVWERQANRNRETVRKNRQAREAAKERQKLI